MSDRLAAGRAAANLGGGRRPGPAARTTRRSVDPSAAPASTPRPRRAGSIRRWPTPRTAASRTSAATAPGSICRVATSRPRESGTPTRTGARGGRAPTLACSSSVRGGTRRRRTATPARTPGSSRAPPSVTHEGWGHVADRQECLRAGRDVGVPGRPDPTPRRSDLSHRRRAVHRRGSAEQQARSASPWSRCRCSGADFPAATADLRRAGAATQPGQNGILRRSSAKCAASCLGCGFRWVGSRRGDPRPRRQHSARSRPPMRERPRNGAPLTRNLGSPKFPTPQPLSG